MSVICLKVRRYVAGVKFPFDRVYLFKASQADRVRGITPVNLTLPIKGVVKELLEALYIDAFVKTTEEGRRLDEEPLPPNTLLTDEPIDTKMSKRGFPGRNRFLVGRAITPYTKDPVLRELCVALDTGDLSEWRMLVPILNTKDKENPRGSKPSYLTNSTWSKRGAENNGARRKNDPDTSLQVLQGTATVPDSAVLKVGNELITPPCRACPRLLEHMHGDCQIGGTVCLKEMSFDQSTRLYDTAKAKGLIQWHKSSDTLEE